MDDELWTASAAASYDANTVDMSTPEVLDPTVGFLAGLAPGGRALELAIGTGRVAIPLRERGLTVAGIDLSQPMLDVLRGKPGAHDIEVATGDMATTTIGGEFDLVYVVFNSISNVLSQDRQVGVFRNAARHLRPGGHFVVELWVPDLQRFPPAAIGQVFHLDEHRVSLDTYDLADQRVTSHHFRVDGEAGVSLSHHRFVWPAELDLMAQLAGMERVARYADWHRAEFTSESRSAVSVWRKPA